MWRPKLLSNDFSKPPNDDDDDEDYDDDGDDDDDFAILQPLKPGSVRLHSPIPENV